MYGKKMVLGTHENKEAVKKENGPIRESNSGPPAPKAGIIPLDQLDTR